MPPDISTDRAATPTRHGLVESDVSVISAVGAAVGVSLRSSQHATSGTAMCVSASACVPHGRAASDTHYLFNIGFRTFPTAATQRELADMFPLAVDDL